MKKIWIINQYASLPSTGIGGRHRHLARELAERGHKVTVIGASWAHDILFPEAAAVAPEEEMFEGFRFVRLKVPQYAHAHDKKRIWNWILFGFKLRNLQRRLKETPDVIVYSSPSLIGYLGAERLARKTGARLFFEIRDFWPLSLMEVGGYAPSHPFIRLLSMIDRRACRNSDCVISNGQNGALHLKELGLPESKFSWVPNGVSIGELDIQEPLDPEFLAKIPDGKFRVVYAGTLGAANSMDTLLEAATLMRDDPGVVFVLVGRGRDAERLQTICQTRKLTNVVFTGPVGKTQVQTVLQMADACYIGWKKSDLYRYGIAANKLFDYMYSGKPILQSYSGAADPVAMYGAGLTVPAENAQAVVDGIRRLQAMPDLERMEMGKAGQAAVREHHDYKAIAEKLEQVLFGNADRRSGE